VNSRVNAASALVESTDIAAAIDLVHADCLSFILSGRAQKTAVTDEDRSFFLVAVNLGLMQVFYLVD